MKKTKILLTLEGESIQGIKDTAQFFKEFENISFQEARTEMIILIEELSKRDQPPKKKIKF